ncbi:substrate-binding periplasmic protein [Piscirickettsia litoralis]|uniref:Solute-binding protein family 3/N-terminal domain-containing protein n=1 Tax=Piscirickettsia litoralis TaxID=1891921 RepID=A0ABX3A6J3_9GAMM|nr:transporter substrate-binding domain-containing protein [Piscirickettsia litoralis]ODN43311.1 hypothetical protein BGC07_10735 [Piscirickettsia litoralis]
MKSVLVLLAMLFLFLLGQLNYAIEKVTIMTEEYPPYNYTNGLTGEPDGFSVALLEKVYDYLGINFSTKKVHVLPWPRGYALVQRPELKNMLFSTTRTAERESLFKWAGPIAQTKIVVFALADSNVTISNAVDLKKYKFAAIRGDIGGTFACRAWSTSGQCTLT